MNTIISRVKELMFYILSTCFILGKNVWLCNCTYQCRHDNLFTTGTRNYTTTVLGHLVNFEVNDYTCNSIPYDPRPFSSILMLEVDMHLALSILEILIPKQRFAMEG